MNSTKVTEQQNLNSIEVDSYSINQILTLINKEDEKVIPAVKKSIPEIEIFIDSLVKKLIDGGRLFYIGAGTSGRLGVLDASECPPTFSIHSEIVQGIIAGGDVALRKSLENVEDNAKDGASSIKSNNISNKDVVLGISASGDTPYVHGALIESNLSGAITGLLTCNPIPSKKYIDYLIPVIVGPEIISGSTRMKAGTATKLVLNMITTTSMIKMNKTYKNLMVDLNACNQKLWNRGAMIVSKITDNDYEFSMSLLKKSNGNVKIAIVRYFKKCSIEEAKSILNSANGSLSEII